MKEIAKRDNQQLAVRTPMEAIQTGLTPVGLMKEDNKGIGIICLKIIDVVEFLGYEMTREQVEQSAQLLWKHFGYLNEADLNIIFDRMKLGTTKTYGSINGAVILKACTEYSEERMEAAEQLSLLKHDKFKKS